MEDIDHMKKPCLHSRQRQSHSQCVRQKITSLPATQLTLFLPVSSCICSKNRTICFPSLSHMWTLCLFLLLLCGTGLGATPDTLRFANIIFRHGDRTPMASYPGDKYTEEDWGLQGYQQLTKEGKMQEYELGQFLRDRYDGFLNKTYLNTEVAAFSTATDRTLMSGQLVLAGLYPPQGEQVWDPKIKWQPIPLQSGPADKITISKGLYWVDKCPKYQDMLGKLLTSKQVLQEIKQFQLLLNISTNLMPPKKGSLPYGKKSPMENIWSLYDATFIESLLDTGNDVMGLSNTTETQSSIGILWRLYDSVFIEQLKNMTIPSWATETFFEKGKKFVGWVMYLMYAEDRARYRGGYILSHWMKKMSEIADGKLDKLPQKVQLYSEHDVSVAAMLCALGVFQNDTIPYSAVLMLELHEHHRGNYSVQIWYRADRTKPPVLMKPPGCGNPCEFRTWMEKLSVQYSYKYPLEIECARFTIFGLKQWMSIAVVAGGGGLLLFLLLIICICCCRKKCSRKRRRGRKHVVEMGHIPESVKLVRSQDEFSDSD